MYFNFISTSFLIQDLGGNITDDLSEVLTLRRNARASLIEVMSSVPVMSLDGLEQTNEVFRVVLQLEQEITLNSQVGQNLCFIDSLSHFTNMSDVVCQRIK